MRRKNKKKSSTKSRPFVQQPQPKPKEDNLNLTIKKHILPQTNNQTDYMKYLRTKTVTLCMGAAGSGKTFLSIYQAVKDLQSGRVQRIIITRPMVETGKSLGALPGELNDKVQPYMMPLLDNLDFFLTPQIRKNLMATNVISVQPLETMRGLDFKNTFMILDEAQNCTFKQLKMFLTRLGENSKCAIAGDTKQTDLDEYSGFMDIISKLSTADYVGVVKMNYDDIQRNKIQKDLQIRLE